MKKLIALLSGLTITASSASMAVACKNYDQKKDGNSILVQFLQSMDGVATIDASDVLWELINTSGPENKENFLIQLLKLINVSILNNSEKNFGGEDSILDENSSFINQGLETALINKWKSVSSAVDLQIQREKDSYQRNYGKKWQTRWKEMLVEKYSVYQKDTKDMDLDFLEAKYKANILLTDATNGATKAILDVLLNTDSFGVTWVNATTVARKFEALKRVVDDETKFRQIFEADTLAIQQIQNASKANADEWIKTTEYSLEQAKQIISGITDSSTLTNDVPEDVNAWSVSGASSRAGMLSNSQLFFLNKYYETKAPLAISEVVIAFSNNQKFDDGITIEDFTGDSDVDKKATEILLPYLTDDTLWNAALVKNDVFTKIQAKASVKTYDSLLTLTNTDYSDTLKSVVYDYMLGGEDKGATVTTTLESLVKLDRKSVNPDTNTLYANFSTDNGNKLAYIDTDGIHIVRIEGYEYFAKDNTTRASTIAELQQFNKFHNAKDAEKIDGIISASKPYLKQLNTGIKSQYLQYLVNSSLLKGLTASPIKYDIMSEVKAWAAISSSSASETYWITTIFEYFQSISKADSSTGKDAVRKFVAKFLVFGTTDPANEAANEIAKSMEEWTTEKIVTARQTIQIAASVKFVETFKKWTKSISSNTGSDYPKEVISGKNFADSELATNVSEKWSTDVLGGTRMLGTHDYYVLNKMAEGDVL